MTTRNNDILPVGTRVRITDEHTPIGNSSGAGYNYVGSTGTVRETNAWGHKVDFDDETLSSTGTWTPYALTPIAQEATVTETPARPTIDFSGPSRKTAREYALAANSRILNEESRRVLDAVQSGRKVDAYALNEAVLDAMRSATTRVGQSMGRRDLATKVAYLGHITQAVLESHADGLPAFDNGLARSRKVAELSEALAAAGNLNSRLEQEISENHRQAVEEGARLAQKVEHEEERADAYSEQIDSLVAVASQRDALLAETVQERGEIAEVLTYAIDLLNAEQTQRVLGFWDGVRA